MDDINEIRRWWHITEYTYQESREIGSMPATKVESTQQFDHDPIAAVRARVLGICLAIVDAEMAGARDDQYQTWHAGFNACGQAIRRRIEDLRDGER